MAEIDAVNATHWFLQDIAGMHREQRRTMSARVDAPYTHGFGV
jgi:hypothetical protein